MTAIIQFKYIIMSHIDDDYYHYYLNGDSEEQHQEKHDDEEQFQEIEDYGKEEKHDKRKWRR